MTSTLRLEPVAFEHPDTQRLVEEVQQEYVVLYGSRDDSPIEEGAFVAPRGAFFLGYVDDVAVAMGGWRLRPDLLPLGGTLSAEIRRMYVAPESRRRGYAHDVLAHLEATAHAAGADVMVLETGTAQAAAIRMYEAAGYVRVEPFGHYTWSPMQRCLGKRI